VDAAVIRKILTHLGLLTDVPPPRPPPADLFGWSWVPPAVVALPDADARGASAHPRLALAHARWAARQPGL